jgi:hypothetical protein
MGLQKNAIFTKFSVLLVSLFSSTAVAVAKVLKEKGRSKFLKEKI